MNFKHFKQAVGMVAILVLLSGFLVAPAFAGGVIHGNKDNPGQPVDIKKFVKPGQTTIIDMYSQYCPPCEKIAPILAAVAAKRPKTQVVKLDINRPNVKGSIDFDSPLAKQQGLNFVPYILIFDEQGQLQYKGQEAINKILEWNK
ncbi:MAG: TlpA family protein disulfide reductase [Desulfobacca sp.]|uniref:TlpA family protein disulfide reductase n=1 Tax=Desulfobacca sp. TaxID=2067990 RepID=UPI004049EED6